jgi:hypothetical protein
VKDSQKRLIIFTFAISLLLVFPSPFLSPLTSQHNGSSLVRHLAGSKNSLSYSYLQSNLSSLLELGYGPGSLSPISQEIPVYTVNDQLWIESNYNAAIGAELKDATGGILAPNVNINPGTVENFYHFASILSTSNLTLLISGSQSFNVTIQFVNPSNNTIGTVTPKYSLRNGTVLGTLSSLNLADKFDIEECLTNASSSSEAQVSLPGAFGSGFIGIEQNPNASTAELFTQKAVPSSPFTFSYELLANFTYVLPSGSGYANSEAEVSRSNSVLINRTGSTMTVSVSDLASLRSGRYVLRAFFENGVTSQISETTLLLKSPSAPSWFWLGSCGKLDHVGPPTISFEENLTGSIGLWPKFLYLMYQVVPGVEGLANVSLDLNLNRVIFVNINQMTLPSYIQVSPDPSISSNSAISGVDVGSGGSVYLISNGTYPVTATFDLLFGGKTFATQNVTLESSYNDVFENVSLGELLISATQAGQGIFNATVTIFSSSFNATIVEQTNSNGVVDVFVPPGDYSITVKSGSQSLGSSKSVTLQGKTQYSAVFATPINYSQDLIWVISIITVLGAVGNFWFWFAKKRLRKFLSQSENPK